MLCRRELVVRTDRGWRENFRPFPFASRWCAPSKSLQWVMCRLVYTCNPYYASLIYVGTRPDACHTLQLGLPAPWSLFQNLLQKMILWTCTFRRAPIEPTGRRPILPIVHPFLWCHPTQNSHLSVGTLMKHFHVFDNNWFQTWSRDPRWAARFSAARWTVRSRFLCSTSFRHKRFL